MGKQIELTRENAWDIPLPEPQGPKHQPINYGYVIQTLDDALTLSMVEIKRDRYELSKPRGDLPGTCMTGLLDVRLPGRREDDCGYSIGVLHDNMCRAGLRILAGKHVFVCDNLMTEGDIYVVRRRHTAGLHRDLYKHMYDGVQYIKNRIQDLDDYELWLKMQGISDTEAAALLYQCHVRGGIPAQYLKAIDRNYFQGKDQPEVEYGTRWGLYNACTRELRDLPLHRRIHYTQGIDAVIGVS